MSICLVEKCSISDTILNRPPHSQSAARLSIGRPMLNRPPHCQSAAPHAQSAAPFSIGRPILNRPPHSQSAAPFSIGRPILNRPPHSQSAAPYYSAAPYHSVHITPDKFESAALCLRLKMSITELFVNALQTGGISKYRLFVFAWTKCFENGPFRKR